MVRGEDTKLILDIFTKSNYTAVKKDYLYANAELKDEAGIKIIAEILKEEKDGELRQLAARSLANSKSDEAVDALLYVVENDKSLEVRKSAVISLGEIGTPRAQQALVKILEKK